MRSPSPTLRHTRWISAIAGTAIILSQSALPAFAQKTSYVDVAAGAYYEEAAAALLAAGALDRNESRLRPGDLATRAEMAKLLVNLHGEALIHPSSSGFNDVSLTAWYSPYIEAAAKAGWIHGDNDCYNRSRPCTARPADPVNRAEAAALLVRAFALERTDSAPAFADVSFDAWYAGAIQTAADHCVLQGDDITARVRPASFMNRAEMVTMFYRAYANMQYGDDCGTPQAGISAVTALSPTRLSVTFSEAVNLTRAEDESNYHLNSSVDVRLATRVSDRVVELELDGPLTANSSGTLTVQGMATISGKIFSGSQSFTFAGEAGRLGNVTAVSSTRVRLIFTTDIDRTRAEDESRYVVTRVGSGGTLGISSATFIDSRTVDLQFATALAANASYRINANNMQTNAGVTFSDSATFTVPVLSTGHLLTATGVSSSLIRLVFDTDLDVQRAQQVNGYIVTDGSSTLTLRTANLLDDRRTVELSSADTIQTQRVYTVRARDQLTSNGTMFTDMKAFTLSGAAVNFSAMLTGLQEIPATISTASGSGTFLLAADGLHYDITVKNLSGSITGAHFHLGATGIPGPVVKPITFTGDRAVGVWTDITDEQRNALLDRRIYVNVHTALHPEGEIRGQLLTQ